MAKGFAVYIVASRSRKLYVGVTSQLLSRVWQHREASCDSFTKRYRIHRLVWFEQTEDALAAIAREKQITGWRRSKKVALIESSNATWEDLAAEWFSEPAKAVPSLRSG
jgi:putative endonuclease